MTELEKCMAGEYYNCHDKVFLNLKNSARKLLQKYNTLVYEQKKEKTEILEQLFGEIGTNVSVGLPIICDYGINIYIGNNVSVNRNCIFLEDIPKNSLAVGNSWHVIRKMNGENTIADTIPAYHVT